MSRVYPAEQRSAICAAYRLVRVGVVNAPYAEPDERLHIRQVTQRVYRGFCRHNDEIPDAIAVFNNKRLQIKELFKREELPNAEARKRALNYIDAFYGTINNPQKVERRILGKCR